MSFQLDRGVDRRQGGKWTGLGSFNCLMKQPLIGKSCCTIFSLNRYIIANFFSERKTQGLRVELGRKKSQRKLRVCPLIPEEKPDRATLKNCLTCSTQKTAEKLEPCLI